MASLSGKTEKGLGGATQQLLQLLLPPHCSSHPMSHSVPGSATPHIRMTLENIELWQKFLALGTEMIITKSGRSTSGRVIAFVRSFALSFIHSFVQSFLFLFVLLFSRSLFCSFFCLVSRSFVRSFV